MASGPRPPVRPPTPEERDPSRMAPFRSRRGKEVIRWVRATRGSTPPADGDATSRPDGGECGLDLLQHPWQCDGEREEGSV